MADVLKSTLRVRAWLTKNEITLVDHDYYRPDVAFTEHAHKRVVLAAATTTPGTLYEFDLGGLDTGFGLFLTTDRAVKVGVDATTNLIGIADNGTFLLTGSYTHVYVRNDNTTYQATVEFLAFDKDSS
jgi:hypothetical protein